MPIGLSTSCSLDIDTEMVELAGTSSKFRSVKPGKHTVTLQCEALIESHPLVGGHLPWISRQINKAEIVYIFGIAQGGVPTGNFVQGKAYIAHVSTNGPAEGYATLSITLQGTGEVVITATPLPAMISETGETETYDTL